MQPSKVTSDPAVLAGEPVLEGTRVSVELILEKLAAGESERQILEAHPHLAEDAVRVALAFEKARKREEALSELAAIDADLI